MLYAIFAIALVQQTLFPLESVKVSGSQVPTAVVMEMAGLKLGEPVDKARIEDACQKLGQSGIFGEVNYRYEPGPQHGYVVTLELSDPVKMIDAAMDIPGADEKAFWAWIEGQFPSFRHRVPQSDEAQQYLASRIEQKLGAALHGQKNSKPHGARLYKERPATRFVSTGDAAADCLDAVHRAEPFYRGTADRHHAAGGGERWLYG